MYRTVKRKIVIFQPHRYTRTQLLQDEFASAFSQADYLIITDIYAASEPEIAGVNAQVLLNKIKASEPGKPVVYLPKEKILAHVRGMLKEGDLVMTLGAGDIVKLSDALAQTFK